MNKVFDEQDPTIRWLLDGDPAIRWQTQRDLLGVSAETWQPEQHRTLSEGWGARLLALQEAGGGWGGGIYSPKWISTTYTLLTLWLIGIPADHPPAQRGAAVMFDGLFGPLESANFERRLAQCDQCITGFMLSVGAYFLPGDARLEKLVQQLLAERMPDGAWNCRIGRRPAPHHSSLHTSFNVLEGLRVWLKATPDHPLRAAVLAAEQETLEFVLAHRLYKSDKTGEPIKHAFTLLSFPYRWHYTILRGLDYFARIGTPYDARLQDALDVLIGRRRPDGTWPVQNRFAGRDFFLMEKIGAPSRWNTLSALRVLGRYSV